MNGLTASFAKSAYGAFAFLLDEYGFQPGDAVDHGSVISVPFIRPPIALEVVWEPRDGYATVFLTRLRDGRIPSGPPIYSITLEDIIRVRGKEEPSGELFTVSDPPSERELRRMAAIVRREAEDALLGEPSLYRELHGLRQPDGRPWIEPWLEGWTEAP